MCIHSNKPNVSHELRLRCLLLIYMGSEPLPYVPARDSSALAFALTRANAQTFTPYTSTPYTSTPYTSTPYTSHPTHHTLHIHTLHPTHHTLHITPYTSTPYTLHITPSLTSLTCTEPRRTVPVMTVPCPLMGKQWSTAYRNDPSPDLWGTNRCRDSTCMEEDTVH